jgi:hypothetical protein
MTKQLPDEPLGFVPFDGRPHLASGGYAETCGSGLAIPREHGHEAAGTLEPCLINELEVSPLPNVFSWSEDGH